MGECSQPRCEARCAEGASSHVPEYSRFDTNTKVKSTAFTMLVDENASSVECAHKTRAEDAEDSAREFRAKLSAMDASLVAELVRARDSAAGITAAFPNGDQRFASLDSDDEGSLACDDDTEGSSVEDSRDYSNQRSAMNSGQEDGDLTEDEDEPCQGLFDFQMDKGPLAALYRAKERYGVDIVAEMDQAGLDLFERIRIMNYIRSKAMDGNEPEIVIKLFRDELVLGRKGPVLVDDNYLKPVIPGDIILTVLETVVMDEDETESVAAAVHRSLKFEA